MLDQRELRNLQLQEIELISNMYVHEIKDVKGIAEYEKSPDSYFEAFSINLLFKDRNINYELYIELPINYPQPNIFPIFSIISNDLSQKSTKQLYEDLKLYFGNLIHNEDLKLIALIEWINTNINKYKKYESSKETKVENEIKSIQFSRYWIYSHHIYSTVKRKKILTETRELGLTGFILPGKPGIICVEGNKEVCQNFWITIKKWNWQRIILKHEEYGENGNLPNFYRFKSFYELNFNHPEPEKLGLEDLRGSDNIGEKIGCNATNQDGIKQTITSKTPSKHNHFHADMGKFAQYLKIHNCDYIIPILFNLTQNG